MDPQLQTFIDQCRHCLTTQPGPAGRQQVATLLQALLSDLVWCARVQCALPGVCRMMNYLAA